MSIVTTLDTGFSVQYDRTKFREKNFGPNRGRVIQKGATGQNLWSVIAPVLLVTDWFKNSEFTNFISSLLKRERVWVAAVGNRPPVPYSISLSLSLPASQHASLPACLPASQYAVMLTLKNQYWPNTELVAKPPRHNLTQAATYDTGRREEPFGTGGMAIIVGYIHTPTHKHQRWYLV